MKLEVKNIKIDDAELKKFAKQLKDCQCSVKVGFFGSARYPDGTYVAYVAYANETGAHKIPRRPFMKRTLEKNQKRWAKGIVTNIRGAGKITPWSVRKAFALCGQVAVGDIKRTIADWSPNDPRRNHPKTIQRKAARARKGGRNSVPINPERALIDTGRMIASVSYSVEMKS